MNSIILIQGAVSVAFTTIKTMMGLFMKEPLVYFVAVALVGAVTGVARKFVPMIRK